MCGICQGKMVTILEEAIRDQPLPNEAEIIAYQDSQTDNALVFGHQTKPGTMEWGKATFSPEYFRDAMALSAVATHPEYMMWLATGGIRAAITFAREFQDLCIMREAMRWAVRGERMPSLFDSPAHGGAHGRHLHA